MDRDDVTPADERAGVEYMPVGIEWKAAADDTNIVEGYAAVFDNVDLHRDVVKPGAFKRTIKNRVDQGLVKLLDSHIPDAAHVLGTVFHAKEDDYGLFIRARISSAPSAQDLRVKMLEGHLDRMSIGYSTLKDSWEDAEDGHKVRHIEEVKLYEVSVVPFPANELAAISAVKEAIRVAGPVIIEAPASERKTLAETLADALTPVFDEPVSLVVGRTPDEVKAALESPTQDSAAVATAIVEALAAKGLAEPKDSPPVEAENKQDLDPTPRRSLKEILRESRALLDGRDPDEVADPPQVAALTTRLELEERMLRDQLPHPEEVAS